MTTSAESIAQMLKRDLDEGVWAPGDVLRQELLAERYGASRIPIREALLQLHAAGLVVVEPNRGATVPPLAADDIREIFGLRRLVETDLLASAVENHTAASLARVKAAQMELEGQDTRSGWLAGDRAFHERLYEPAGKPRTLRIAAMLRDQVERYALRKLSPGSRRADWKKEHRALIEAVVARDSSLAVRQLEEHLERTCEAVVAQLS